MKHFRTFFIILLVVTVFTDCAARTPTPKTAQSVAKSYFKTYAHKYPASEFGHKNCTGVSINQIEEISYRFALVDAMIDFSDGKQGRSLIRMQNKFPGGWRVVSWEMLGYR
jgi:phage terminase large subunit-like protein